MAKLREVLLLIGEDDVVLWSDASDSPVALPDSRARWEQIWSRRARIVEIAHSHPVGPQAFSREDETTMTALVTALGRPITFSVVAPSGMVRCTKSRDETFVVSLVATEPWWATLLRLASSMETAATRIPKTPQEE
ncbi:MAG TPA: Mov34/MPN/PAD-1 family protein [Labilithrix sp.]|nr:Mov34/MPN/PAD-1 family protein [Labilithrix sp.]